jgi:hypothetical protein
MEFMVWPLTSEARRRFQKLDERAVAHELDHPARIGGDHRIDKFAPQCL